jgi:hypothetical protein
MAIALIEMKNLIVLIVWGWKKQLYLRPPNGCGRGGIGRHARLRIWCREV